MHAVRLHAFGPAENLTYEEVPDPVPGPGQVRIAVGAAGVHLLDTALREGEADQLPFALPNLPLTVGREVAGVVDAVGAGVEESWLGRRVAAHLGFANAGYAEFAVREADALHPLPDGVAFDTAVAMVGTGRTALAILHLAELTADDVVLVTAAAGGVGTLLVQAARNTGATVVGAAGGAEKVERVRALGADVAVDYDDPEWPEAVRAALGGREVTVALDGVGGRAGRAALELIGFGGRLLLFGWSAGKITELSGQDLYDRLLEVTVALGPRLLKVPGGLRGAQDRAIEEAAAGRLVPAVTRFPLREAAAAHRALQNRGTIGKVVLIP
ncbi:zinc-binding dehydrogenase [Streptomyces sp. NPDC093510]|uniref:zinc-binding dehydrogenase n=1 Tax=Streptomyces sp. NPDC093510 TaxID=3155199 RepID=UPI0034216A95